MPSFLCAACYFLTILFMSNFGYYRPHVSRNDLEKTDPLFVCFVALRPKSTAMVVAGRSVHLTTLIPGQA